MALNLRSWEELREDREAYSKYITQPAASADQLYEVNFHLMEIKRWLVLTFYVLTYGVAIVTAWVLNLI